MKDICLICEEGMTTAMVEKVLFSYRGVTRELDSHYRVCDTCGSDFGGAEEMSKNKKVMLEFRSQVDESLSAPCSTDDLKVYLIDRENNGN